MKKTILISFFLLLFLTTQALAQETDGQKLERMLAAFSRPGLTPGFLDVSFEESVSKQQAQAILAGFGLAISQSRVCGPSTVDPGQQISSGTCSFVDDWSDSLKLARVAVPEGQEREFAELLYRDQGIAWVEPVFEATIAGGGPVPQPPTPAPQQPSPASPLLAIAGVVIALLLIAASLARK